MKETVGLLTCYMDNFGACLQAYALQRSIIKAGYNCEIVKYTPIKSLKDYGPLVNIGLWIRNHIKGFSSIVYSYENNRHTRFESFRKKNLVFSKQNYLSEELLFTAPPKYDIFVTGSDQIWNPNLYGGQNNKAYFLDFVPAGKKRIAYAPSIGVSSISQECGKNMADLLSKFDAVSVREEDGKHIIDSISDCGCRVVLDPTLLLTKEEWDALTGERMINEDYVLIYLFGDRSYIKEFVDYVRLKTGLKIVTLPFHEREYQSDYTKIRKAGPIEFVNLIKHASLVITDSFHATAFSINLHVPFYSLLRNEVGDKNNMNSRIYNILSFSGLNERMIADRDDFPNEIIFQIDFSIADKKINEKRKEDFNFLKDALEGRN